ncbi:hypothetical protein RD792_008248 [Penstemon davidsonii]|uniref:J domain-containing protein n=1 Tax=Penstemon davidsonii TaxID=160366 RepID=A0ABR0D9D5_9LAMI|nr:hypothetical protein RD792_008248 [Penstemon davidsonii]
MQFHPDKHSQSSKHLRDSATIKFKQISEAYDTLIDDRKRADYNFKTKHNGYDTYNNNSYRHYNTYNNSRNSYGYGYSRHGYARRGGNFSARFEMGLRFLTTRSFLLNATFFGVLLGGMFVVEAGGKALWKMHNPGKSFEEAMDSVEKAKALKDDSY